MKKKILKEWFPNKEEVYEFEQLAKQQERIYNDAADMGLRWTPKLASKIKSLLTTLKKTYGGRATKWGDSNTGGASYVIFIPIEHSDYERGKYNGELIKVSLNMDPKLRHIYHHKTNRFFDIDISRTTILPQDAEKKYGSKFFND